MFLLSVIGCSMDVPTPPPVDTDDGLTRDLIVYQPPQVDVLFVVDSSTSMWGPIDTLEAGVPIFVQALAEEGFDYHAGAANIDYDDQLGWLEEVNDRRWADATAQDPGALLGAMVGRVPDIDPREVARAAVHRALGEEVEANHGFLREGSQIAVIIVSDAPDDSEDYGHVSLQDFLLWFQDLRPAEDSTVHGLVQVGGHYSAIIGPTGGVEWSFDNTPFGPPLRAVIDTLHHRRLPLSEAPVLDSLEVHVLLEDETERLLDPQDYTVDLEGLTVEIQGDFPLEGESVRFTYVPLE